jgi:lipopolysaccharide transport system permease protein
MGAESPATQAAVANAAQAGACSTAAAGTAGNVIAKQPPSLVIEAQRRWRLLDAAEIWRYRDLFYFLAWRDVAVRYKQTVLGVLWAIIQPVMTMVVFTVFFGRLAGLDQRAGGVPYPVFVYAGLLPWTLFSQAVSRSSESLVGSAQLITKVYFPRLIVPAAATGACLVDFAIACAVLVVMMLGYGMTPPAGAALLPAFLLLTVLAALGIGTLISALNVAYRDFRYVVPFMMQLWMLATPAIYAKDILPARWKWLGAANPMNAVGDAWRSCILDEPLDWASIAASAATIALVLVLGLAYFRHAERQFADVI